MAGQSGQMNLETGLFKNIPQQLNQRLNFDPLTSCVPINDLLTCITIDIVTVSLDTVKNDLMKHII